jgi:hypothetical protein
VLLRALQNCVSRHFHALRDNLLAHAKSQKVCKEIRTSLTKGKESAHGGSEKILSRQSFGSLSIGGNDCSRHRQHGGTKKHLATIMSGIITMFSYDKLEQILPFVGAPARPQPQYKSKTKQKGLLFVCTGAG